MIESLKPIPQMLLENAEKFGATKVAIREKDYGIWQAYSFKDYLDQVRDFALGMASLGFKRGDRMAIIGDNRPQLYWGLSACQCLGGIPVPLYQDATEKEFFYILDETATRWALAEDQEQSDKLLALKEDCPTLEYVFYDDPKGMSNYTQPFLKPFTQIQEIGRNFGQKNPKFFLDEVNKIQLDDLAIIAYTSGTTGNPKGVMLEHRAVASAAKAYVEVENLKPDEEIMAYLPIAWLGDHLWSFGMAMMAGFAINCPEDTSTIVNDTREIGPTLMLCPPRIWENWITQILIKMEDASYIKRKMFHFFMNVASRIEKLRIDSQPISLGMRTLYQLGRFLVYAPLIDNMGMRNVRIAYTGGESIGLEALLFFRSLGINLKQIYGMTESCALTSIPKDGDLDYETVGMPVPGVDIKISENMEVMIKGPGNFIGYYKNPEATKETLQDGYILSGDAGYLTDTGRLKIIDRCKDVSKLDDGRTLFAPKYIENKLKFSPYIKEAVAFGKGQAYVAAFIDIDYTSVGSWAERQHIPYTSYTDLAQNPQVYGLIYEDVMRVNKSLSEDEKLKAAQIRRFLLLHKELDPDDGEITRTRKVRRLFIAEKYGSLIDALYSGQNSVKVNATIKYEDGRMAKIKATLAIRDVDNF